MPCGGPDNTINIYEADGAASTTESIIGSTMEPTVPTTEDVVTYSSVTMPEVRDKEHTLQVQLTTSFRE